MTSALIAFAIFVGATVAGFVISWIWIVRTADSYRFPRATLTDTSAVYAADDPHARPFADSDGGWNG